MLSPISLVLFIFMSICGKVKYYIIIGGDKLKVK